MPFPSLKGCVHMHVCTCTCTCARARVLCVCVQVCMCTHVCRWEQNKHTRRAHTARHEDSRPIPPNPPQTGFGALFIYSHVRDYIKLFGGLRKAPGGPRKAPGGPRRPQGLEPQEAPGSPRRPQEGPRKAPGGPRRLLWLEPAMFYALFL